MSTYICKLDASGWQLYSDEPGETASADAAHALSEALSLAVREAKARLSAEPLLSERKLAESIRDSTYRLMARFSAQGATDTEPCCVLVAELERAFGLDSYSLDR